MTIERRIFVLWLTAAYEMDRSSDSRHNYFLGKATALTEAYAEVRGITFVQASRELMNERANESLIGLAT
jgi:hypothetical protein